MEGQQVWDLLQRCAGQLRLGGMGGVAGVDFTAALEMADALGIDRGVVALMLPKAERGLVAALNKRQNDG